MTKFGEDFIIAVTLIVVIGIGTYILFHPGMNLAVRILAGIVAFDSLLVLFLMLTGKQDE